MEVIVATALVCGTVYAIFERMRRTVLAHLKEQAPTPIPAETMPEGLVMLANAESERWAREDKMKMFRQMYEDLGDWGQVARILHIDGE